MKETEDLKRLSSFNKNIIMYFYILTFFLNFNLKQVKYYA